MKKTAAVIAIIGALAASGRANAQTINLDIGGAGQNYTGTAIAPDLGTFWNNLTPGGTAPMTITLSDSFGNALSGASLTISNHTAGGNMYYFNTTANTTPNPENLMRDYTFFATYDLTVSGLSAGSYNFWFYGDGDQANQAGTINFGGVNTGISGATANSPLGRDLVNGGEGISYKSFSGLTVDGSGVLSFSVVNYLNGFQLTAVPEPSALALAGLGLGLAGFARRRR
jgi:hypothetical protein